MDIVIIEFDKVFCNGVSFVCWFLLLCVSWGVEGCWLIIGLIIIVWGGILIFMSDKGFEVFDFILEDFDMFFDKGVVGGLIGFLFGVRDFFDIMGRVGGLRMVGLIEVFDGVVDIFCGLWYGFFFGWSFMLGNLESLFVWL